MFRILCCINDFFLMCFIFLIGVELGWLLCIRGFWWRGSEVIKSFDKEKICSVSGLGIYVFMDIWGLFFKCL